MAKVELSHNENVWLSRVKLKLETEKNINYICSWWLRLDYKEDEPGLTTTKINYWLTKLVNKGYLTKEATKNYTRYKLTLPPLQ